MENNWWWGTAEWFGAGVVGLGGRSLFDEKVFYQITRTIADRVRVFDVNVSNPLLTPTGVILAGTPANAEALLAFLIGPEY